MLVIVIIIVISTRIYLYLFIPSIYNRIEYMFSKINKVDNYKHLPNKLSKSTAPKDTLPLTNRYQKKDTFSFIPYIFRSSEEPVVEKEEDARIRKEVIAEIVKHTKTPDMFVPYPFAKKETTKPRHTLLELESESKSNMQDSDSDLDAKKKKKSLVEMDFSEVSELEQEKTFILDEPDVIMRGIPFYYLNETEDFMNDTLTTEWLANFEKEEGGSVEIHLALYKLNTNIDYVPFVTYLLEKTADMYQFPHFTMSIPNDPVEDVIQINCENECKRRIFRYLDIFPSETFQEDTLSSIVFKGYVMREKEVLAVFEMKNSDSDSESDSESDSSIPNSEWVTLHEMINTKFVHKYLVHPFVSIWFLENPAMMYITDKFRNAVEIPYVLYLLQKDEKKKETIQNKEKKEETKKIGGENEPKKEPTTLSSIISSVTKLPEMISSSIIQEQTEDTKEEEPGSDPGSQKNRKSNYTPIERSYAILPPKITHLDLGKIFLFAERGTEIARKVVFITNTLYLLDQPPKFSLFSKKNYDSIYFQEFGEPIWGVKNPVFFGGDDEKNVKN